MRPSLSVFALPVMIAGCLLAPSAQAEDASVKARLDAKGIHFEVDDDGDYRVTFSYDKEGRTQLVFVEGKTEDVDGLRVRQIFSPAARLSKTPISDAKTKELLEDNSTNKLGAWEISGDILYFVIKIPDTLDAAQLESTMNIAASAADDMEAKLSGEKDEL